MRHQKQELLVYIVYILLSEGPFFAIVVFATLWGSELGPTPWNLIDLMKFMLSGAAHVEFLLPFSLCRSPLFYGLLKRPFQNTWDFPGISWIGDLWSCSEFIYSIPSCIWSSRLYPQGCFHCTSIFVACRKKCVNTKEARPLRGLYWHLKFESYPMTFFPIFDVTWIRANPSPTWTSRSRLRDEKLPWESP